MTHLFCLVSMEASLEIPVVNIGGCMCVSTERTVNIGKTQGSTKSKTNKWKIEFPSRIPRKSQ